MGYITAVIRSQMNTGRATRHGDVRLSLFGYSARRRLRSVYF
jgi:hypothetical protein